MEHDQNLTPGSMLEHQRKLGPHEATEEDADLSWAPSPALGQEGTFEFSCAPVCTYLATPMAIPRPGHPAQ